MKAVLIASAEGAGSFIIPGEVRNVSSGPWGLKGNLG